MAIYSKQVNRIWYSTFLLVLFCLVVSCKKGWLDAKPQRSLVVPNTIADYQALLDNTTTNSSTPATQSGFNISQPALGEVSSGDFSVSDVSWAAANPNERNAYIWASDIFGQDNQYFEWEWPYQRILFTNVVLEGIEKIVPLNSVETDEWRNVKGAAYFFRAYNHYSIAQLFCKSYDVNTASTDLGIPLKLNSNVLEMSVRASVKVTYEQVVRDLKEALSLLPISTPINIIYKCRPTKAAAYAMLARVYLSMGDYDNALDNANECLNLYSKLMDYNVDISNPSSSAPVERFNSEVIFQMTMNRYLMFLVNRLIVEPGLYYSYSDDDWRKTVFFRNVGGNYGFRGSYDQSSFFFSGLATDEIYLIRAECYARKNNVASALQDLNTLLINRWKNGTFNPINLSDANDVLKEVVNQRRLELCFRGLRWSDLRRLNKDPQFAITLNRTVSGQNYTLVPNDNKYVFPIPPNIIQLSNMPQNPR